MPARRFLACLLSALLALPAAADAQQAPSTTETAPPAGEANDVQPKFWGLIINFAITRLGSLLWDIFARWAEQKLMGGLDAAADRVASNVFDRVLGSIRGRSSEALSSRAANVVVGNPGTPPALANGKENYQGVHMAMLMQQQGAAEYRLRAVNAGFRSGERFKLRVLATFDGELTIDNINPGGQRRQIYPPRNGDVVAVQAGQVVYLPLGRDEHFEFTRATGRELLVINIADPRAVGQRASRHEVFRRDVEYGSNFVQQVDPESFARISQAVALEHQGR